MLTIKSCKVCYGDVKALDIQEPLTINKGEKIGIIGSNGAGKTTLINALLGLVPYQGKISSDVKPEEMGVHMQFNEYVDTMPIKYVMEAILGTKISKNARLQELIQYFEFEGCLKKKFTSLSGGQKQRFTIILVMMQDAPITFYDEVTSGLDFETRQKLMDKLADWYKDKQNTLCIISHYYEELELLADKLLILDQGNVIAFGSKEELFHKYCGRSVLIMENNQKNIELTKQYKKLESSEHNIVISCENEQLEKEIATQLLDQNVNFKRSNNDIELVFINAKSSYYSRNYNRKATA